jgi:hypothetical protein
MLLVAFQLLILIMHSCQDTPSFNIRDVGLTESTVGREDVLKAIQIVNKVFGKSILAASWLPQEQPMGFNVFIVNPDGLPYQTIAQSDSTHLVIFVSSEWRQECKKTFESILSSSTSSANTLAIIMLHEIGHLIPSDSTKLSNDKLVTLSDLKPKMLSELQADHFAAAQIVNSNSQEAAELRRHLLFLDSTVAQTIAFRAYYRGQHWEDLYEDINSTHPNLYLRFAIMSYYTSPTEDKLSSLKWLMNSRNEHKFSR